MGRLAAIATDNADMASNGRVVQLKFVSSTTVQPEGRLGRRGDVRPQPRRVTQVNVSDGSRRRVLHVQQGPNAPRQRAGTDTDLARRINRDRRRSLDRSERHRGPR